MDRTDRTEVSPAALRRIGPAADVKGQQRVLSSFPSNNLLASLNQEKERGKRSKRGNEARAHERAALGDVGKRRKTTRNYQAKLEI